jgi:hypothetical protein
MKLTSRRVADLERKTRAPGTWHTIHLSDGDQEAALDRYGRARVGPNDHIIHVPTPRVPGLDG